MVKGLTTYLVEPDHGMWASRRKPEAPNFARRVKCAKKWGRTASSKSPGSTTRRWGKETNTAQIDLEIRHLAYPAHQQPQAADESRVPPLFQSRTENPRITQILPAAATAVAGGDLNTDQLATYPQLARVNK
jgi:hypothetical protein